MNSRLALPFFFSLSLLSTGCGSGLGPCAIGDPGRGCCPDGSYPDDETGECPDENAEPLELHTFSVEIDGASRYEGAELLVGVKEVLEEVVWCGSSVIDDGGASLEAYALLVETHRYSLRVWVDVNGDGVLGGDGETWASTIEGTGETETFTVDLSEPANSSLPASAYECPAP